MSAEILIIDDNPDIRNIIRDLISEFGYKTRVAANYNQALKEIDKAVKTIVGQAADFALESPEPDVAELYTDVLIEKQLAG